MFTGIISHLGTVTAVSTNDTGAVDMMVATDLQVALGDSVAVDGVCLSQCAPSAQDGLRVQLSPETVARTTLGGVSLGTRVHLEPAMRLNDTLGGHFVSGHVDGIATITDVTTHKNPADGQTFLTLSIAYPACVAAMIAEKGSVTLNGVSLTVNQVDRKQKTLSVSLIPITLARTTFAQLRVGSTVNLEADLFARYVHAYLQTTTAHA